MKNVDVTKNQAVYATVDVAISYDIINGWPRRRHPDAGRPFPGPFWDVLASVMTVHLGRLIGGVLIRSCDAQKYCYGDCGAPNLSESLLLV